MCSKKKNKGKGKNLVALVEVEEFATQFVEEFSFVVNLSTSISSSKFWYIDSEDSRHMTSVREHFLDLAKGTLDLEVVLGDDHTVRAIDVGTVSFERESQPPLKVIEVLYVHELKKNFILVSTIKARGFQVVLRDGLVLMYPKGSSITSPKVIGVLGLHFASLFAQNTLL